MTCLYIFVKLGFVEGGELDLSIPNGKTYVNTARGTLKIAEVSRPKVQHKLQPKRFSLVQRRPIYRGAFWENPSARWVFHETCGERVSQSRDFMDSINFETQLIYYISMYVSISCLNAGKNRNLEKSSHRTDAMCVILCVKQPTRILLTAESLLFNTQNTNDLMIFMTGHPLGNPGRWRHSVHQ